MNAASHGVIRENRLIASSIRKRIDSVPNASRRHTALRLSAVLTHRPASRRHEAVAPLSIRGFRAELPRAFASSFYITCKHAMHRLSRSAARVRFPTVAKVISLLESSPAPFTDLRLLCLVHPVHLSVLLFRTKARLIQTIRMNGCEVLLFFHAVARHNNHEDCMRRCNERFWSDARNSSIMFELAEHKVRQTLTQLCSRNTMPLKEAPKCRYATPVIRHRLCTYKAETLYG
jgi:hypothetical protein